MDKSVNSTMFLEIYLTAIHCYSKVHDLITWWDIVA